MAGRLQVRARPGASVDVSGRQAERISGRNFSGTPSYRHGSNRARAVPCHATFDYYKLLGVSHDADHHEIKRAYRHLQKRCHPDISGDSLGHEMGVLLNEAYKTLSNSRLRRIFDQERKMWGEDGDYTGQPLSNWAGAAGETKALFVDEHACTGCLDCAMTARSTFAVDLATGRARVVTQWADSPEDIALALDLCPVSCIHKVQRDQLPALEHVMKRAQTERRQGRKPVDPFVAAGQLESKRRERVDWERRTGGGGSRDDPAMGAAADAILWRHVGGTPSWWHEQSSRNAGHGTMPAQPEAPVLTPGADPLPEMETMPMQMCALVPVSTYQRGRAAARFLSGPDGPARQGLDYLYQAAVDLSGGGAAAAGGAGHDGAEYWESPEVRTCAVPVTVEAEAEAARATRIARVRAREMRAAQSRRHEAGVVASAAQAGVATLAVMALLGYAMAGGGGAVGEMGVASDGDGPVESAAMRQQARDACYRRGGGLCRFNL